MATAELSEMGFDNANGLSAQQQRTIYDEKRARKLAEEDALRLLNRVKQLEKEEEKAEKRIADTQRKAREIIAFRERNELKQQEKERRLKELEADIERQKADNFKLKDEIMRTRTEAENAVYAEKYHAAQQGKEEHEQILRAVQETRLLNRKDALEQKEAVRRSEEEARQRLEQLKLAKLQQAQDDYDRRLQGEMDAKSAKEREIEKLAQMELQLIERLKSKQTEQKKAYQQLEAVLSLGGTRTKNFAARSGSPAVSGKASPSSTTKPSSKPSSTSGRAPAASSDTRAASMGRDKPASPAAPAASAPLATPPAGEPTDEDMARAFSVYDQEGTGMIESSLVEGLLRDLGMALNPQQLVLAISQLDPEGQGKVSFGHFLMWWRG